MDIWLPETPFPSGFYDSEFLITGCSKQHFGRLAGTTSCGLAMNKHQMSFLSVHVSSHVICFNIHISELQKSYFKVVHHMHHLWRGLWVIVKSSYQGNLNPCTTTNIAVILVSEFHLYCFSGAKMNECHVCTCITHSLWIFYFIILCSALILETLLLSIKLP